MALLASGALAPKTSNEDPLCVRIVATNQALRAWLLCACLCSVCFRLVLANRACAASTVPPPRALRHRVCPGALLDPSASSSQPRRERHAGRLPTLTQRRADAGSRRGHVRRGIGTRIRCPSMCVCWTRSTCSLRSRSRSGRDAFPRPGLGLAACFVPSFPLCVC